MSANASSLVSSTRERASFAEQTQTRSASLPWYIWTAFLATACSIFGLYWDISWHMSIGRDTFWTPAHLVIQAGAVLGGLSCAFLILHTSFAGSASDKRATVNFWGFRAPLGAFIIAWGGFAMITSAPFDNWWHEAYGLDVKIVSPPHTLLLFGLVGIQAGSLVLVRGAISRSAGAMRGKLERVFLVIAGLVLIQLCMFILEYTGISMQHSARCYYVVGAGVPLILIAAAKALDRRWTSTTVAGVYTVFWLAMQWIFPLFPATPKLGPVYQPVTHMVPLGFALPLIVPALAIDLLFPHIQQWSKWAQASLLGSLFLAVFVLVEWPFAEFLLTPMARNWFFGSHYLMYSVRPESSSARHVFAQLENTAGFWSGMAIAVLSAILSSRVGLVWGAWMSRVTR
jgi:hypothetical protein